MSERCLQPATCKGIDPSGSRASVLRPTCDFDGAPWENLATGLEERAFCHARPRHLILVHRPGGRVDPRPLEERDT